MSDQNKQIKKSLYYRFVKRTFDIVFSIIALVIGLIPSLIICLLIFCMDWHSPIFKEKRMVRIDKERYIYKFRTMVTDSDNHNKYFTEEQKKEWENEHKVKDDPRILGNIGKFLRKTSLDEIPQFIHVLTGKMSTIGPRIITKDELKHFGNDVKLLFSMKPGITGLWQTSLRNNSTFEDGTRQKIELEYIKSASFLLDCKLFWKTFYVILFRRDG